MHNNEELKKKKIFFNKFLNKARKKFGNKFTYIEDSYISSLDKMRMVCPVHGEYLQSPGSHLRLNHGCPSCGFEKSATASKDTLNSFLEKAYTTHGNQYDYSKVKYINSTTPVEIICKKHNFIFPQEPASHVRGRGCKLCGFEESSVKRSYTQQEFINKIKSIQGDDWDYSELKYVNFDSKVKLICKEHGPFYKNPRDLISRKTGCPKCSGNHPYSTKEYIKEAHKAHGDKYDYSKTIYVRAQDKVTITCKKHGDFDQIASGHIVCKYGCPKCSGVAPVTQEEFIERSKQIHGDRFEYNKISFTDMKTKVILICKIHGGFPSRPSDHIYLQSGCPTCKSSKGELRIYDILKKYEIPFKEQFIFDKYPRKFRFDFYLPMHQILIEFHGIQHFESIDFFGAEQGLKETQKRDKIKIKIAAKEKIPLIEMTYKDLEQSEEEFEKLLLLRIKKAVTENFFPNIKKDNN